MKETTTGTLYGVGVGPGDPELITIKAVQCIRNCPVIAFPAAEGKEGTAFQIASQTLDLHGKELLPLVFPMTKDTQWEKAHRHAAEAAEEKLKEGKDIAFLTLGDPSVYSTYSYLSRLVEKMGFHTQMIPGVPSFCAVAARLNRSLAEGACPIHIIPLPHNAAASGAAEECLKLDGTKVLMKSGKAFQAVKTALEKADCLDQAQAVCNCGMEGERVFSSLEDADENTGYFSIIVVKQDKE